MGETRRKFDRDFREGAVRLVRETAHQVRGPARFSDVAGPPTVASAAFAALCPITGTLGGTPGVTQAS